jgi:hypothetical protein
VGGAGAPAPPSPIICRQALECAAGPEPRSLGPRAVRRGAQLFHVPHVRRIDRHDRQPPSHHLPVHVHGVAMDVGQQAAVAVRELHVEIQADLGAGREQEGGGVPGGCAEGALVELGGVDQEKADALAAVAFDGVAVHDPVHAATGAAANGGLDGVGCRRAGAAPRARRPVAGGFGRGAAREATEVLGRQAPPGVAPDPVVDLPSGGGHVTGVGVALRGGGPRQRSHEHDGQRARSQRAANARAAQLPPWADCWTLNHGIPGVRSRERRCRRPDQGTHAVRAAPVVD